MKKLFKKNTVKLLMLLVLFIMPMGVTFSAPLSFAPLVKKTLPAVVRIQVETEITSTRNMLRDLNAPEGFDEFFKDFFPQLQNSTPQKRKSKAQGSGFVFEKEGYILTNNHVVYGATKITVIFANGKKYDAKIIGTDKLTDLAVLKIESNKTFPVLKLGKSNQVEIGDWVIAVGSPLNVGLTVTKGIISARGRNIQTGLYDDYLQTDAPINRGNSGGPLINMDGEVVGINTVIISPTGANVGLGFAIPSKIVKRISKDLMQNGIVKRGYLGVVLKPITEEIAESLGLKDTNGVILTAVGKDTPAEKAGLKLGDIVTTFNGEKITDSSRLPVLVAHAPLGKKVSMKIIRNGTEETLYVKLIALKEEVTVNDPTTGKVEEIVLKGTGLFVTNLSADLRKQFKVQNKVTGVFISSVDKQSNAYGYVPSPAILERINNIPVANIVEAENVVKLAHKQGKKNILLVISTPNRTRLFITIGLQGK